MQILTLLLLGLAALVACQPIEKTTKSVVSYTYGPHHHQGPPVESATLAGRSVEDKHDDEPGDDPPNGHPHDDNDDTASSLAPRDDAAVHSSLDPSADPSLGSLLDLYHGSDITINLDTLVKSECHYEHRGALFKLNYGRTEVCTAEWYSSGKEAEAKTAPTPKATAKPSLGPLSASSLSTPPGSSADPSAWSVAGDTVRAVLMALRTPNVTSGLTISARRIVEHQCRIGPFGLQKCELTWEKQHYPVLEPPPAAKEPSSKANDKTGASLAPRDDEPLRNPLPVPVDVPVDSLSSDPPAGTVDDNDYPGHDITIDEDQIQDSVPLRLLQAPFVGGHKPPDQEKKKKNRTVTFAKGSIKRLRCDSEAIKRIDPRQKCYLTTVDHFKQTEVVPDMPSFPPGIYDIVKPSSEAKSE